MYLDYRYIPNSNNQYIISNIGDVFSLKFGRVRKLKQHLDGAGYLLIKTCCNKVITIYKIHILVGNAFVGVRTGQLTFDHIDRYKENNRADNIRLSTRQEQALNKNPPKKTLLGYKNITIRKYDYIIYILRNKKILFNEHFTKKKYSLDDCIIIRDCEIKKYNNSL